jgi:hypothetical protein
MQKPQTRPSAAINFLVALTATLVTLVAAELLLRQTDVGAYSAQDRLLIFSHPSFVEDDAGALRYAANTTLREVAIYGDTIEYDTTTTTNSMGFIDRVDYPHEFNGGASLTELVLGDSFTAGAGGTQSWVARLDRPENDGKSPHRKFYNLGVAATGILHFERLLRSATRDLDYDAVNVAAIGNDFFRPLWRPASDPLGVRLCQPGLTLEAG